MDYVHWQTWNLQKTYQKQILLPTMWSTNYGFAMITLSVEI